MASCSKDAVMVPAGAWMCLRSTGPVPEEQHVVASVANGA